MADSPVWREAFEPVLEIEDLPTPLKNPVELASGKMVTEAPGCFLRFDRWNGERMKHDFRKGESAMIDLYGEHLFGETAILRLLEGAGWSGRWVETYGSGRNAKLLTSWDPDRAYKDQIHVPIDESEPRELLCRVSRANGQKYGGCWDIFAWKSGSYLFAEAKAQRMRRALSPSYGDRPNENQGEWLKAALDLGDDRIQLSSFVFVQWDYR